MANARSNISDLASFTPEELSYKVDEIGCTPLVSVRTFTPHSRRILLKLEGTNPGGSIKDRVAYYILDRMEESGRLKPGDTIIESTSGNMGVALAWLSRARGYRFIAVTDPIVTAENSAKMLALGADIEQITTPDASGGYLESRIAYAREVSATGRAVWIDQYTNADNPATHYKWTGPELLKQLHERVDAVFIPASTGGTLAGIGAAIREHAPGIVTLAVDGEGSSLFTGNPGVRQVIGLGSSHKSPFIHARFYDGVMCVAPEDAFAACRKLYQATGYMVGGSGGAAISACIIYMRENSHIQTAVCICPDHGANYLSTIFNNQWIESKKFNSRLGLRIEGDF